MKWIKKLFEKAKNFFTLSDEKAKKIAKVAVNATDVLNDIIASPVTDVAAFGVKKIIKGEADDILIDSFIAKARKFLPELVAEEVIVLGLLENSTLEEKANYVLNKIKFASDVQKNEFAHKFSIRLILALSDGKLTYGEAVVLAEMAYQELKRNNTL